MRRAYALAVTLIITTACGDESGPTWECVLAEGADAPDSSHQIGCDADFSTLSSEPPTASIPGARSIKTIVDRLDDSTLYFINSRKYPVHYDFASALLSGNGLPIVPPLGQFNQTEYYSPDRRFLLGALTYYAGPDRWVYEIAPYDTATPEMIAAAYGAIADNVFVGDVLYFHPTSEAIETAAAALPASVRVITTDQLFADIDYQPLNLGTSMGRLAFARAEDVEDAYVSFRDIVVLDAVPNDISVTAGIVTEAFQTPLSHINVLSQNRGTPNMSLRGAFSDPTLRALDGKWVELTVGPFEFSVREVTQAEADAWWDAHRPPPLGVPDLDLSVTSLTDIRDLLLPDKSLRESLDAAIPAFGGKASHYAGLLDLGAVVNAPEAFGIPVYFYRKFMTDNGFDTQIDEMLADPTFRSDPAVRDQRLEALRDAMKAAPLDPAFEQMVLDKLAADYPGVRMRFRSSTNAEDLDGFTGAGLYTSKTGDPNDPEAPVADAIRKVWASVWKFRAFEEREFRGIDHTAVGMALLVHRSFPDEEINGVALTANIFDRRCAEPGFYINAQAGEASVVKPEPGVTTDQLVYHYAFPGHVVVWLSHSNLIPQGQSSVMTRAQTRKLGDALAAIHAYYFDTYGAGSQACERFYGMDVEFKFDGEPGEEPVLFVKQARPHPGWGLQ